MKKTRKEIWKDIGGYEGFYQVSSNGRVRSLDRMRKNGSGTQLQHGIILRPSVSNNGYLHITLSKDCKVKTIAIHRLVAQSFIPNPQNLPQINHKDEDKANNKVENLEWCTHRYNQNYGTRTERIISGNKGKGAKAIIQLTLKGEPIQEWVSLSDAGHQLQISIGNIYNALKGKRKQAGGFKWEYKK